MAAEGDLEILQVGLEEFADERATDPTVKATQVRHVPSKVYSISDLKAIAEQADPNTKVTTENITIEGKLVWVFRLQRIPGQQNHNRHKTYIVRKLDLADLNDPNIKIRISVWGTAIEVFKTQKPKCNDRITIKGLKMTTNGRVGKAKVLPLDISCNSTKMSDYKIVIEMGTSNFTLLKEINRDDDWRIINVRATIITKEERTEDMKVITIRQHEGPTIEVTFWVVEKVVKKDSEPKEWHPNFNHLRPKMFCSFIGLQVRYEGENLYLNSSEFTRITQLKDTSI